MPKARIRVIHLPSLPPMAWCAVVRPGAEATVVAGSLVEETERGFFEGAWNSDYGRGHFHAASVCCGTGGTCRDGHLEFATPTDTLQALYTYRTCRELLVSNSLHLLLRVSRASLRPSYLMYDVDLMTVMHGLSGYRRAIPTTSKSIARYYHCNVKIDPGLTVTVQSKPTPPPFPDFASYHRFLVTSVQSLVENAAAPSRRGRFQPLATVSTGYDSPACAVLAKSAGCEEAITFTTARSEFQDSNDRGGEVGAHLNLSVSEFDPCAYLRSTTLPECEFVAAGFGADDVVFSSAEAVLPGRILLTGFQGGRVWSGQSQCVSTDIVRGDPSGSSLPEFRLRVGFINAPVPFFGCVRHPEIHAVSISAEMAHWSVGGSYDRPIPRRIAEEAHVPRHAFGTTKKAVARPYLRTDGRRDVRDFLSERSLMDFTSYLEQEEIATAVTRGLRRHALSKATIGRLAFSYKVDRMERALGIRLFSTEVQRWRYSQQLSAHSALFRWASAVLAPRYANVPTSEML